jgi:hypothetical protein
METAARLPKQPYPYVVKKRLDPFLKTLKAGGKIPVTFK